MSDKSLEKTIALIKATKEAANQFADQINEIYEKACGTDQEHL
jgi:hypothetical protein